MTVRPVILCGGAGTRLWPMSRPDRPKPLLALVTERSLLQDTLDRTRPLAEPWLVCGAAHDEAIALEAPAHLRIVEPVPRGTAPAAVAAALLALDGDPDALLLLVPADHAVSPDEAFLASVARGRTLAQQGWLVTFGIQPRGPDDQFGWIQAGEQLEEGNRIVRFVEKPARAVARTLYDGGCLWNSGLFLFRADRLLEEVRAVSPALVDGVRAALDGADRSGERIRLGPAFVEVPEASLDVLVMQRTTRGAVVPASFRWADVGTWPSVIEARGGRAGGLVLSDGPVVKVLGDPEVLVAVTGGAVLVATPAHAHAVQTFAVPNPAVLDRGPGWQLERRFVAADTVFDGEGTAVLLAGHGTADGRALGPGELLPAGARATSASTWLVVRTARPE